MKHENVETVKSHNLVNNKRGITLIALVVTIIVLIILALISINAVFGENGLITSARRAEVEHTHGTVWEYMEMEYSNYWIGKVSGESNGLIEYLQKSHIIGNEVESGKYIINVEKLVGRKMALGNGKDNDIYKLERVSEENTGNITKVATVKESVKLAKVVENKEDEKYQVKYYGPEGDNIRKDRILGVLGDDISSSIEESNNPNFTIQKKRVGNPPNGEYYRVGEPIYYEIKATNLGTETMKTIKITDVLVAGSGTYIPQADGKGELVLGEDNSDNVHAGDGYWVIDSLESNQSETIRYSYTVQEGDVGEPIKNTIMALTGKPKPLIPPKGEKEPEIEPDIEEEVPTVPEGAHLTITKEVIDKKNSYRAGEKIKYRITLKNDGEVRIDSFEIQDILTSKGHEEGIELGTFTEFTEPAGQTYLDPGETGYIDYEYTVTAKDLGGPIKNKATIVSTEPPVPKPPKGEKEPEVEIPQDGDTVGIDVVKEVVSETPPIRDGYATPGYIKGDEIKYKITVTNTGTIALENISIVDIITTIYNEERFPTLEDNKIDRLEPGESRVITYSYIVGSEDMGYDIYGDPVEAELTNTVKVTGQPTEPGYPEVEDTDEKKVPLAQSGRRLYSKNDAPLYPWLCPVYADNVLRLEMGDISDIRYDGENLVDVYKVADFNMEDNTCSFTEKFLEVREVLQKYNLTEADLDMDKISYSNVLRAKCYDIISSNGIGPDFGLNEVTTVGQLDDEGALYLIKINSWSCSEGEGTMRVSFFSTPFEAYEEVWKGMGLRWDGGFNMYSVQIVFQDDEGNWGLSGVKFRLRDSHGNLYTEANCVYDYNLWGLNWSGEYVLEITEVPEGYAIPENNKISFEIPQINGRTEQVVVTIPRKTN